MTAERQLRQEIAALEHELRRVSDGLERDPSERLQRRADQLRDSLKLCRKDLIRILANDANDNEE